MNSKALDQFLAGVERRAFRTALLSVRDEQAALDIVQDSMMRLAMRYAEQPAEEWPLIFQRILQNAILDHHRRQKVRRAWVSLFGDLYPASDSGDSEPGREDSVPEMAAPKKEEPEAMVSEGESLALIEAALEKLPLRQRQAFLLRYWEDLDVAEAAKAMGCSEGSVKTHCFRAVKALSEMLAQSGLRPNKKQ